MIKHSNSMSLAELCRSERIKGCTDGRRDLKEERKRMRERMREREEQGKVEKIGRSRWRVIYGLILLCLAVPTLPSPSSAETQSRRAYYDRSGAFVGSAATRGNTTTFYSRSGAFVGRSVPRR